MAKIEKCSTIVRLVLPKLVVGANRSFQLAGTVRVDDTVVHRANRKNVNVSTTTRVVGIMTKHELNKNRNPVAALKRQISITTCIKMKTGRISKILPVMSIENQISRKMPTGLKGN